MNFIDTLKSVELVLETNEVPLIIGESVIGKTALAKKLAKENNFARLLAHAPYTLNACAADESKR